MRIAQLLRNHLTGGAPQSRTHLINHPLSMHKHLHSNVKTKHTQLFIRFYVQVQRCK